MKRGGLKPNPETVRAFLNRHRRPLPRKTALRRSSPNGRRTPDTGQQGAREAWNRGPRGRCVMCGDRARDAHHIVYAQHLPDEYLFDLRNRLWLCRPCHEHHHSGSRPIPLAVLRTAVFEFAGEVMGAAAFDYLTRRYKHDDPRVDDLLLLPIRSRAGRVQRRTRSVGAKNVET